MECYLTVVCALAVCIILTYPHQVLATAALWDLTGSVDPRAVAIPFALKATLSGSGLILNVLGLRYSQILRFCGGLVGSFIWCWLTFKFAFVETFLLSFAFTLPAAYASIRIMALSLIDLPRPGARPQHV